MQIWLSWKWPRLLICCVEIGYSNSLRSQILQINSSAGNTTTTRQTWQENTIFPTQYPPPQTSLSSSLLPFFFSSISVSKFLSVTFLKYHPYRMDKLPHSLLSPPPPPLPSHLQLSIACFCFFAQWTKRTTSCSKGVILKKSIKVISVLVVFHFWTRCMSELISTPSEQSVAQVSHSFFFMLST